MFFIPASIAIKDISSHCRATIVNSDGNDDVLINGASPIETATAGHISFIDNPKYLKYLENTKASAVFCVLKNMLSNFPKVLLG